MNSVFKELFDHKLYRQLNPDLQKLSSFRNKNHCYLHYIHFGIKENRLSGFPNKDLTNQCINYFSQNLDNSNKFYQSFNKHIFFN